MEVRVLFGALEKAPRCGAFLCSVPVERRLVTAARAGIVVSNVVCKRAPAFDLNPDPRPGPKLLSTAIDEHSREAQIDTAMDVAEYFRMGEADAKRVLGEVVAATEQWRRVAVQRGLDGAAMDQMARAFEHAESERAREILSGVRSKVRRAPRLR